MKAYIGAGVAGALALAGVIGLTMRTSAPVQASPGQPGAFAADAASQQPILVNCGEGRQAMVRQSLVGDRTVSRVECVPDASLVGNDMAAMPSSFGVPGQQFQAPVAAPPVAPPAKERVVYRDRPVYRDRVVERPVTRTASTTTTSSAPATSTSSRSGDYEPRREPAAKPGRSWRKSAVIIGGSAAGGAGVGAVLGGRDGAKKGAVLGGVAGTIYDIATRNKDTHR